MLKLALLTAFTLIAIPAMAQPCCESLETLEKSISWYTFPLVSKHTHTETKHNQQNFGVGYETDAWGRNWQIGTYKNSYWKQSTYLFTELTSFRVTDRIRFRINGGLVTGYQRPIIPMAIPVWTYERQKWGMDVMTIPSVGNRMGIYAIQFKVRF